MKYFASARRWDPHTREWYVDLYSCGKWPFYHEMHVTKSLENIKDELVAFVKRVREHSKRVLL